MRLKSSFACLLPVIALSAVICSTACRRERPHLSDNASPSPDARDTTAIATATPGGAQHPRLRPRRPSSSPQLRVDNVLLSAPLSFGKASTQLVPNAPVINLYRDSAYNISARMPKSGADSYEVYVYKRIADTDVNCELRLCWQYLQKVRSSDPFHPDISDPLRVDGDVLVMSWIRDLSGDTRADKVDQFSYIALAGGHEFAFRSGVKVSIEER